MSSPPSKFSLRGVLSSVRSIVSSPPSKFSLREALSSVRSIVSSPPSKFSLREVLSSVRSIVSSPPSKFSLREAPCIWSSSLVPQSGQNFAPSFTCFPHCLQNIIFPPLSYWKLHNIIIHLFAHIVNKYLIVFRRYLRVLTFFDIYAIIIAATQLNIFTELVYTFTLVKVHTLFFVC